MTYGLDTSVVIRLITGTPEGLAHAVMTKVATLKAQGNDFVISDLALSETYFALQEFYGFTKVEALKSIRTVIACDGFAAASACVGQILALPKLESANPGFLDRVLAGGHAARGEITLSCEKSFKRLPMAEVIA